MNLSKFKDKNENIIEIFTNSHIGSSQLNNLSYIFDLTFRISDNPAILKLPSDVPTGLNSLKEAYDVTKGYLQGNLEVLNTEIFKNENNFKYTFFKPYDLENETIRDSLYGKLIIFENNIQKIVGIIKEDNKWEVVLFSNQKITSDELFKNWTFSDGNYCGVLKDLSEIYNNVKLTL